MSDAPTTGRGGDESGDAAHDDWPRGVAETSVWPVLGAAGAAGVYVGVAALALSTGHDAVLPAWPGAVVFGAGVAVLVAAAGGWLYDAFVRRYRARGPDRAAALSLRTAMVLFLATEVATFGAGFAYYLYVRAGPWPPGPIPALLGPLVFANTLVLLASSGTLHLAQDALRAGDRGRFLRRLGLTVLLGAGFLAGQAYEYYEFVVAEGYALDAGSFASAFYGLTGLHGLHVALGVLLLGIVLARGWLLDHYASDRTTSVDTVSMYWHFVDAVWLVLVATVYVGASLPLA